MYDYGSNIQSSKNFAERFRELEKDGCLYFPGEEETRKVLVKHGNFTAITSGDVEKMANDISGQYNYFIYKSDLGLDLFYRRNQGSMNRVFCKNRNGNYQTVLTSNLNQCDSTITRVYGSIPAVSISVKTEYFNAYFEINMSDGIVTDAVDKIPNMINPGVDISDMFIIYEEPIKFGIKISKLYERYNKGDTEPLECSASPPKFFTCNGIQKPISVHENFFRDMDGTFDLFADNPFTSKVDQLTFLMNAD
jgi:hypothetical protein